MKRDGNQSFENYFTTLQEAALIAQYGQSSRCVANAVIEQFMLGLQFSRFQEVLMHDDFSDPIAMLQRAQKIRDSIRFTQASQEAKVNAVQDDH